MTATEMTEEKAPAKTPSAAPPKRKRKTAARRSTAVKAAPKKTKKAAPVGHPEPIIEGTDDAFDPDEFFENAMSGISLSESTSAAGEPDPLKETGEAQNEKPAQEARESEEAISKSVSNSTAEESPAQIPQKAEEKTEEKAVPPSVGACAAFLSVGSLERAAMVTSASAAQKEAGIKLAAAALANARDPDRSLLDAIPEGTPEEPRPWIASEGESSGLPPVPPKGSAPSIEKKKTNENAVGKGSAARKKKRAATGRDSASKRNEKKPSARESFVESRKGETSSSSEDSSSTSGLAPTLQPRSAAAGDTAESPARGPLGDLCWKAQCGLPETPRRDVAAESPEENDAASGFPTSVRLTRRSATEKERKKIVMNLQASLEEKDADLSGQARAVWNRINGSRSGRREEILERCRREALGDDCLFSEAAASESAREELLLRDLAAEDAARDRTRHMPLPAWDTAGDPLAAKADYARRMDEWEKALLEESLRGNADDPGRADDPQAREFIHAGTETTIGGFPSPVPLREWSEETSRPSGRSPENARISDRMRRFLSQTLSFWEGSDLLFRFALHALVTAGIGAGSAALATKLMLPGVLRLSSPVSVAAVVREEDVRERMMLANLLEQKGLGSLNGHSAGNGRLLTDDDFREALKDTADTVGAPILSSSAVLALPSDPGSSAPRTIDVTDDVTAALGLSALESAAAKELLNKWLADGSSAADSIRPDKNGLPEE